jgi:hypothetical protein
MRFSFKKAAVVGSIAAAGVLIGASVAWAATSGHTPDANDNAADGHVSAAAPIDTSTETKFTAITPCRIVDTRSAGGALQTGVTRSFHVAGTVGFPGQGGNNGGCGIPSAATAVAATVVAVNEAGPGFLVTWPTGGVQPFASFMNYANSNLVSSGVTMTINGSVNIVAGVSNTDMVLDVSGYYIKPLFAHVAANASIIKGSRTTGALLVSGDPGQYEVDFDRDVSQCAYAVSIDPDTGYTFKVQPRSGNANGVFVRTNFGGTNTSVAFYLTVTC